jgi:hypothetical protein
LVLILGAFVLSIAGVGFAAAAVYHAGSIAVDVQDRDTDFRLAVPAAVVHLAVMLTPASMIREATREAEPYFPAIAAGWQEFERTPDFVLVSVESPRETVRVEKRGDRILVLVEGQDGSRVNVAIPLRTVRALISKLD